MNYEYEEYEPEFLEKNNAREKRMKNKKKQKEHEFELMFDYNSALHKIHKSNKDKRAYKQARNSYLIEEY